LFCAEKIIQRPTTYVSPAMPIRAMNTLLPDYDPPHAKRAAIAVGVAPVIVLLAFTLIVCGLIDVDLGFALFAGCTAWVVLEMHRYQKTIDSYHDEYANSHPPGPELMPELTPELMAELRAKPKRRRA
jgi:hypothetical protein